MILAEIRKQDHTQSVVQQPPMGKEVPRWNSQNP